MSSPAFSQQVGPWLASRVVAELDAKTTNELVAAVLRADGWDDLTAEQRKLLEQARAEFEGAD